jgi:hypothetical protein
MPAFGPVARRDLIRALRQAGFDGPYSGGKHPFMIKGDLTLRLSNGLSAGRPTCGFLMASAAPAPSAIVTSPSGVSNQRSHFNRRIVAHFPFKFDPLTPGSRPSPQPPASNPSTLIRGSPASPAPVADPTLRE